VARPEQSLIKADAKRSRACSEYGRTCVLQQDAECSHLRRAPYRFELEDDFVTVYRRIVEAQPPKPAEIPAALAVAPAYERKILISSAAIEEAKRFAVAARLDIHWLERTYVEWAQTLDEPARNEDARFLSWVRSLTKAKAAS
jgi:hypothetical protein